MVTTPFTLFISPNNDEINDDLPEPTGPTTATSSSAFTEKFILFIRKRRNEIHVTLINSMHKLLYFLSVGFSGLSHVNVPPLIDTDSSSPDNHMTC